MFKVEPIGSNLSSDKSWDEKGQTMISNIYVTFDNYHIKSIQFIYFHEGAHVESQKHGSSGGQYIKRVKLEIDEYVTALGGVDNGAITCLTFHTNKRKHGPFCKRGEYLKTRQREIDVGIRERREFGGLFGSFSDSSYGSFLTSIGMYVCHNTSSIDAVPRTRFGANYVDQFIGYQSLDPIARITHYQSPRIFDGFPVKPSYRNKSKLKDRILSKLHKAIRFFIDL